MTRQTPDTFFWLAPRTDARGNKVQKIRMGTHLTPSEFQGTQRVRDVFQRIYNAVSVIVGRVDAPRVACAWVRLVFDTVCPGVPHCTVVVVKILLEAEIYFPLGKASIAHGAKQLKVLFGRSVAVRTDGTLSARGAKSNPQA